MSETPTVAVGGSVTPAATASASVLLVGLSFRSAPVTVLEKASVHPADMEKMRLSLLDGAMVSESLVLSTCNRMELYTVVSAFHSGLDHVVETIANYSGLPTGELEPHLYVHFGDSAAEHMLNVASGLDSMVVGEQQIIGQLRTAYQSASDNGTVGRTLHDLTQRALHTGKRVHSETLIDTAGASMVSFSVDRALRFLPSPSGAAVPLAASPVEGGSGQAPEFAAQAPLTRRRALIIGAGAMASLASTYLGKLGIDHITVANRTLSRAENLVAHAREAGVDASAVPFSAVPEVLGAADLVISATGAVGHVVSAEDARAAVAARRHCFGQQATQHPVVFIDLSMPADIDRGVGEVEGAHLLNIEELTNLAGEGAEDEDPARAIVAQELEQFLTQQREQAVVPTVKALRRRAADVVSEELLRLENHTPDMSEADRRAVEKAMRRVVDKLLHTPTVQAKKLSAGGAQVSYPDALAALFNLPVGAVDTVLGTGAPTGAKGQRTSAAGRGNNNVSEAAGGGAVRASSAGTPTRKEA